MCDFSYVFYLWLPSMMVGIALMTCSIVEMAMFSQRVVTRVAHSDHFNDSSLVIDLGNGALEYRVCNGSVAYTCQTCDNSQHEKSPGNFSEAIIIISNNNNNNNNNNLSLSQLRSATALASSARKHPDDICTDDGYCGAALHFDQCSDQSALIAQCGKLAAISKPLAAFTLATGILGILPFLVSMCAIFCIEDHEDNPSHVVTRLTAFFNIAVGITIAVLCTQSIVKKDELMNCATCCSGIVTELGDAESDRIATQSLAQRSFTFDQTVQGVYIANAVIGSVFAAIGAVALVWGLIGDRCAGPLSTAAGSISNGAPDDDDDIENPNVNEMFSSTWGAGGEESAESGGGGEEKSALGHVAPAAAFSMYPPVSASGHHDDNHPTCSGGHRPFSYSSSVDCGNASCQLSGRKVCVASCPGCPDAGSSDNEQQNHPRCRGQHGGSCGNVACMSRPVCVASCSSCPDA